MSTAKAAQAIGVVHTKQALRARIDAWRSEGLTIAFAPTMGALHEGHLSLIKQGRALADRTVASIFVNPTQFAPGEDLETYPRDERRDLDLLEAEGCDLAYLPSADQIYPEGFQTRISVEDFSKGLCGASRPHFFGGVATVVCKLLHQCRPDIAVFGEKDFQQLRLIDRMVRDLDMDIDIVGAPIVREPDGLAMSSRNAYLSAAERAVAGGLNVVIAEMAAALRAGENVEDVVESGRRSLRENGFEALDYLEVRRADDLSLTEAGPAPADARIFAAAMVGKTRLIDNCAVFEQP